VSVCLCVCVSVCVVTFVSICSQQKKGCSLRSLCIGVMSVLVYLYVLHIGCQEGVAFESGCMSSEQ
jgi:hypothetical protein